MTCKGKLKNISIDWKSRKAEATFVLDASAADIEKYSDKDLSVEFKKYSEKRSLDANAYYWVLVSKLAKTLEVSNNYIHNDMLRKYGQIELIDGKPMYLVLKATEEAETAVDEAETYHLKPTAQVKAGKDGELYRTYMMLKGSHEYDTQAMSRLIKGLANECTSLGIEVLTPEELARMMEAYDVKMAKHNAKESD